MANVSSAAETPLALEAVVLASASSARVAMLHDAGLDLDVEPAPVDEVAIRQSLRAEGASCEDTALALAGHKAQAVSRRRCGEIVIGGDQILDCDGEAFDKPVDLVEAAAQLRALSGRDHHLVSAVCVVVDERLVWHCVDRARLCMRPLTEDFIAAYLAAVGDTALEGPGAYRIEGPGSHLFSEIAGDHFTVLGLPLLPLLAYLRERRAVLA